MGGSPVRPVRAPHTPTPLTWGAPCTPLMELGGSLYPSYELGGHQLSQLGSPILPPTNMGGSIARNRGSPPPQQCHGGVPAPWSSPLCVWGGFPCQEQGISPPPQQCHGAAHCVPWGGVYCQRKGSPPPIIAMGGSPLLGTAHCVPGGGGSIGRIRAPPPINAIGGVPTPWNSPLCAWGGCVPLAA